MIKKTTLHPYNDKNTDLYPKTDKSQITDFPKYLHIISGVYFLKNVSFQLEILLDDDTEITSMSELYDILDSDVRTIASGMFINDSSHMCVIQYAELDITNTLFKYYYENLTTSVGTLTSVAINNGFTFKDSVVEI